MSPSAARWLKGALSSRALAGVSRFLFGVPERPRRLPRFAWLTRSDEAGWSFALLAALPYLVYLVWAHLHHEPWRDETHPWIVARQAEGFWDIVTGDRIYDGHPPGWYWALYVFTFVTHQVWGLHAVTLLASLGAALLFLRFAPFPRPLRVLLVWGYLFAHEYGVFARNYTLGVFFAFSFASLLRPLRARPLLLGSLLVGLCLSNVYGTIIACSLLLVLLAEGTTFLGTSAPQETVGVHFTRRTAVAGLMVLTAAAFAFWTCRPPDPNPYAPALNFNAVNLGGLETSLARMTWATLPLRVDGDLSYWTASDQVWRDSPRLFKAAEWALLAAMLLCLVSSPVELLAFVLGTATMAVIQLAAYGGFIRHWGHYFILFLTLCWTARTRKPLRRGRLSPLVLAVIGLFQLKALWVAARMDAAYPFSGGPEAAARMRKRDLARLPIVGGPDWAMPAVTAGLDREFISCETQEWNQTLVFHSRRRACSSSDLLQKAFEVSAAKGGKPVVVVTIGSLPVSDTDPNAKLVLRTRTPSLSGEDFAIYEVKKP